MSKGGLVVAASPALRDAEVAVLEIVADRNGPIDAETITRAAIARNHDEFDVFSAIWFLIDRGKLHLTRDLSIEAAARP